MCPGTMRRCHSKATRYSVRSVLAVVAASVAPLGLAFLASLTPALVAAAVGAAVAALARRVRSPRWTLPRLRRDTACGCDPHGVAC